MCAERQSSVVSGVVVAVRGRPVRSGLGGTVESVNGYNVNHGRVRSGNQCGQRQQNDDHVFDDGKTTHAARVIGHGPASALTGAVAQIDVGRRRYPVSTVVAIRTLRVSAVAVLPKRDQVDEGRAKQAQHGEKHRPEQ